MQPRHYWYTLFKVGGKKCGFAGKDRAGIYVQYRKYLICLITLA